MIPGLTVYVVIVVVVVVCGVSCGCLFRLRLGTLHLLLFLLDENYSNI